MLFLSNIFNLKMHIDKIDHDDLDKQKRFSSDLESQNPLFDLKKVDILIEGL